MNSMKVALLGMTGAFALSLTANFSTLHAQDHQDEQGMGMPEGMDMEAMMEAWNKVASPSEKHRLLDAKVGEWDLTIRFWMAGPDGPAEESKGTATAKWILDGRYIQEDVNASFVMGDMAMPFKGMGLLGYDNFKGKYTSLWIDNMSTAISHTEGVATPDGTTIKFFGTMDEPMTGERDKTVMYVWRLEGKDRQVFEAHDFAFPEGKTRVMEIVYERK